MPNAPINVTCACAGLQSNVKMTFIGTATAIIDIDGVKFLTDPFFSPANTVFKGHGFELVNHHDPAITLEQLPPIDAVLLSHEDHWDNLDDLGRRLLDGRHVLTTMDGAKNLAPRPGVVGMQPWQEVTLLLGDTIFHITATPAVHLPGGECTGFIVTTASLGKHPDGRLNAICFTGDTIYTDELPQIAKKFHIAAAVMNTGGAHFQVEPPPAPKTQITLGGKDAARLFYDIKADWLIPMHFDDWDHFTEHRGSLKQALQESHVDEQVIWLEPGKAVEIF